MTFLQTGRKSRLLSRTKKSTCEQVFVNNRRSTVNVWEIRNVKACYRIKFLALVEARFYETCKDQAVTNPLIYNNQIWQP